MKSLLEIENLSVTFTGRSRSIAAVRDVSLTVAPGQVVALVGESGSGKTVTASAVVGLLPSSGVQVTGNIRLEGAELLGLPEKQLRDVRGKRIGTIFQNPATSLDPSYKIGRQMLELIRHHLRLASVDALALAGEWLTRVGIADPGRVLRSYPHELSGGMRQRVMIAIACIPSPSLLLADEPTTALDPTIQRQVLDVLAGLRRDLGISILIVTHDFGVVSHLADQPGDQVAVLRDGSLVEAGPADDLLSAPQHEYTRLLIDSVPVLAVKTEDTDSAGEAGADEADSAADGPGEAVAAAEPAGPPSAAGVPGAVVPEVILAAQRVSKTFRIPGAGLRGSQFTALDTVELRLRRGESVGLIGESGSGKSTLARVITGLLTPSDGLVTFDGSRLSELPKGERTRFRRTVQIVFQDHGSALNPRARVGAQLTRPLLRLGVAKSTREATAVVTRTLGLVGLDASYLRRYPHQLSGGQRQRVGIARALALEPVVLILDEPTSALDVTTQAQVLALLADLKRKLDIALVLISHNLAVVSQFADRVVVLNHGQVVDDFAARDFLDPSRHQVTRDLLSAVLPLRRSEINTR